MNRKMHARARGGKWGGAVIQGRGIFRERPWSVFPKKPVLGQEKRQSGAGESASRLPEELAPGSVRKG